MDTVVQLEGVTRTFGRTPAAIDVTLDVVRGEVFGLLGHNGAGKTTLIRLINGLLIPDRGTVRTLGLNPLEAGHVVRRRTGVLTTYPGLDDYLSAAENLAVYARIHGLTPERTHQQTGILLSRLEIDPASTEPVRGLSAGLKQRVALARALIHAPELLLLDEPTANLDPMAARGVRHLVRQLADEGRTVIFSSHNLAEAESLCDRVAILRDGRLLAVGAPGELAMNGAVPGGLDLLVGPAQGERALAKVRHMLNGHPVTRDGDTLSISGRDPDLTARLIQALVDAEIDVHAAIPRTPSLEDVYFSMHHTGPRS